MTSLENSTEDTETEIPDISELDYQDYSGSPREQVRYLGETSGIRFFNPEDSEDMQRLNDIMNGAQVVEWMEETDLEDNDIIKWAQERSGDTFLFAVTGSSEKHGGKVTEDEIGEVQGFIYFYGGEEEKERVAKLIEAGMLPKAAMHQKAFETSSARLDSASLGQMASARRQTVFEMNKLAKTDEASLEPQTHFYCFIDPDNINSIRAVEAAGFVYKGRMRYDEDSETEDSVYVLDWSKLQEKITSRADQEFINSIRPS